MTNFTKKTLLVIAPHADDEVLGCGGLIGKVKEAGGKSYVLFLTNGSTAEFSKNGNSNGHDRLKEIKAAVKKLGIDGWRIAFPGDVFHLKLDQFSQKALITEIESGEKISIEVIRPDIIAFPVFGDYNQDHHAAAEAAFAACRPAPADNKHTPTMILSYEAPFNIWSYPDVFHNINFIVELTPKQLENKLEALRLYKSQIRRPRHPRHPIAMKALAILRGSSIGVRYGEGYQCHKLRG